MLQITGRTTADFFGLQSYDDGLQLQENARRRLQNGESQIEIIGLEHTAVVTLGVRGDESADLTCSREELQKQRIELHRVKRGGQGTLHSPGQLVIYPCCDLRALRMGPRAFVQAMENTTQNCLKDLGIVSEKSGCEPGLFVIGKKIASFGFHISHGIVSHGIAINVTNDLELFKLIRPCGVTAQVVTRLSDLGHPIALSELFDLWNTHAHCFKPMA